MSMTAPAAPDAVCPFPQKLETDSQRIAARFNRDRFLIAHSLADDALFGLPRLVELARAINAERPKDLYFDAGDVGIGQRWEHIAKLAEPVDRTIQRIEHAGAWIILRKAEQDPAFGQRLDMMLAELLRVGGRKLESRIKQKEMIIFITSPKRVTPYHIDRECSFLLQVRGTKQISVFDPLDPTVLPQTELERFWSIDTNAAVYKPDLEHRAQHFILSPGVGVHIPVNAPHWIQNHDNVSISVNINVVFQDGERANLYRANHYLRKLGLNPTPPFAAPGRDAVKRLVGGAIFAMRERIRRPAA